MSVQVTRHPTFARESAGTAQPAAAPESGGLAALQAANQSQVRRQVEAEREASIAATASGQQEERVAAAKVLYERIADSLRDAIMGAAPAAELTQDRNMGWARKLGWVIRLGDATFTFTNCNTGTASWGDWQPPAFTIDAWGELQVRIPRTYYDYEGRSHSLWFGDIQRSGQFGWYETSFMLMGLSGRRSTVDPFSLDPGAEAAKAVWNGMAEYQLAWPFTQLEPGESRRVHRALGRLVCRSRVGAAQPSVEHAGAVAAGFLAAVLS